MTTATDHAIFVRQEYRRAIVADFDVYARNPQSARSISVDTQLNEADAKRLASNYLVENHQPRTFEIVLEGIGVAGDFVGGPPSVLLESGRFTTDGRTLKVFSINEDFEANTTTIQVRG